jgi:Asp-tRNA(Asn)/Glu-tRNA(Gln) amidotransferase A subunit family amidase
VRIPASFCGVLGLKPSFGRIPFTILPSQFDQISHFGPLARDVMDLRMFMEVVQGPDERDIQSLKPKLDFLEPLQADVKGKRFALCLDFGNRLWHPDVEAAVRNSAAVLKKAGATIEEVKLSWSLDQDELWAKHWSVYLASFFGHVLPEYKKKMDPIVVALIERGLAMSAVEFKQLEFGRTEMWKELSPILERCDALLCPTMAQPAPGHGRSDQDFWRLDEQGRYLALDVTSVWNFVSQCPAISIPAGFTKDGLPIGLQVIGRRFDDLTPIAVATVLEKLVPWADKRPPI